MRSHRIAVALALSASTLCAACDGATAQADRARFVREIPWQGRGVWLKADTHVHTDDFSDGGYVLEEVAAGAAKHGCDVLGITDHLDVNLKAATPEYFAAIDAARKVHSGMTILAGGEWNLPPWGGDEHATVLLAPAVEAKLADFKRLFDDHRRPTHDAALAREGLLWLAAHASPPGAPAVVVYEHPSRADHRSIDNAADIRAWRRINDVVIGFAGAPGHQALRPYGDYQREQTIDRWDPVVARTGDAWDVLLAEGLDVWGAYVASDFHTDRGKRFNDFWPCEFGATWLYAPQRDAAGALQALRAGSFFAEHGGIARAVELQVSAPGLTRPAVPGEAINAAPATTVTIALKFEIPRQGADGAPNHVDRVQIITIDAMGAEVLFDGAAAGGTPPPQTVRVPKGGLVVRARGYRGLGDERLAFYTNPVRITN